MLNCKISKAVSGVCGTSVSGVKKIAIANWSESHSFTASSGCTIDTIDLGEEKFYEIYVGNNSASFACDLNVGSNKDLKYFTHSVSGTINKIDCDLLSEYTNIALSTIIVAVLTKNNEVYILGIDNGLSASSFNYASGAAEGDAQGVSFVFDGAQPNPMVQVKDWSTITNLF